MGQHQVGAGALQLGPRPFAHEGDARLTRVLEALQAPRLGQQGDRVCGAALGQVLCDLPLQLARLAAVLGELDRPEALGQGGEAAAGIDGGELGPVADQHQARRGPGGVAGEALERASRHHRGLVDHDHRSGGDGVLSPLDPAQQERGGLGGDARLALQQVGRLALPGERRAPALPSARTPRSRRPG